MKKQTPQPDTAAQMVDAIAGKPCPDAAPDVQKRQAELRLPPCRPCRRSADVYG